MTAMPCQPPSWGLFFGLVLSPWRVEIPNFPPNGDTTGTKSDVARKESRQTLHNSLFCMVGTAGFEPATHGLKGRCSTD